MPEWMADMGLKDGIGGAKEKNDKDAIWVTELTDSLTVAIALREWTRAVELVEEGLFHSYSVHLTVDHFFVYRRSKDVDNNIIGTQVVCLTFISNLVVAACPRR